MPGNRNPLDPVECAETKVVRLGGDTKVRCYLSKSYKISQNRGLDSPFFGSIFLELIGETKGKPVVYVMVPKPCVLEFGISLF